VYKFVVLKNLTRGADHEDQKNPTRIRFVVSLFEKFAGQLAAVLPTELLQSLK